MYRYQAQSRQQAAVTHGTCNTGSVFVQDSCLSCTLDWMLAHAEADHHTMILAIR